MRFETIYEQIKAAEAIACVAHHGQYRRDGRTPYITHPEAVARIVMMPKLRPIAWLHDVVEDTLITLPQINAVGFDYYILAAVRDLTRHKETTYEVYIRERVCPNPEAVPVKIADMLHNLSCQPSQNSVAKARWALPMLREALEKHWPGQYPWLHQEVKFPSIVESPSHPAEVL